MKNEWKNYTEIQRTIDTIAKYDSIVFYDLETTGIKKDDRILQFSAVKYNLKDWKEEQVVDIYIKCPFCINGSEASKVNGITDELLREKGLDEFEAFDVIKSIMTPDVLISGYNIARFDNRFMTEFYKNMGKEFQYADCVDVYPFVKLVIPSTEKALEETSVDKNGKERKAASYKLEKVMGYYFPDNDTEFHSAINDVRATCSVLVMAMADAKMMIKEKEEEENKRKEVPRQDAIVYGCNTFEKSRFLKRVYVRTNQGTIYFDTVKHTWSSNVGNIDSLNIHGILEQLYKKYNIDNEEHLFAAVQKEEKEKAS